MARPGLSSNTTLAFAKDVSKDVANKANKRANKRAMACVVSCVCVAVPLLLYQIKDIL